MTLAQGYLQAMYDPRLEMARFLITGEVQPSTENSRQVLSFSHYLKFLISIGKVLA